MFSIAFNGYSIFDGEFAEYYEYVAAFVGNLAFALNGEVACHPNVDHTIIIIEISGNIIAVEIDDDFLLNL